MGVRPPLPTRSANPYIKDHLSAPQLPAVKYQILSCQGKDILVGRLKIDTPTESGHAFILRRYDTGAISLTSMFRAAFPSASDMEERLEIQWVRDNYDLSGNNGSTKDPLIIRLAGTWADPQLAIELGKVYSLGPLIHTVVDAIPDPNGHYRRSTKNLPAAPAATTTAVATPNSTVASKPPPPAKTLPTPSPTSVNPPAAKRRKDASPVPSPNTTSGSKPSSRASPLQTKSPASTRRSTRKSKSPAPRTVVPLTSLRTPKRDTKLEPAKLAKSDSSDLTAVDEEGQMVENGVVGVELMKEDIKSQKALIEDLARQRAGEPSMDTSEQPLASKKREREEEETLMFEFKEPESQERTIATNSRVTRLNLEPRTKSFAWGVAAFAIGMGAVAFLPNYF